MKRFTAAAMVLSLSIFAGNAFSENVSIRLTNGEWPPYLSENLEHYGIATRIVTEAFALQGIDVEYDFYPWNRSLMLARKGHRDGTVVWSYSEKRAQNFYFSDPVINATWVFFHLKETAFDWEKIEDVKEFTIGGTIGYFYSKAFNGAEEEGIISVNRIGTDEANVKLLLKGRIDIFPLDINVGYTMIHNLFSPEDAERFTPHPLPVKDEPLYVLLSKNVEGNKEVIERFNKGLKELRESGKIDEWLPHSSR